MGYAIWTDEELELLKNKCHRLTLSELCELIPTRSESAILSKLRSLNLTFKRRYNYWTQDDVGTLLSLNGEDLGLVCQVLSDKDKSSIVRKVKELKLDIKSNNFYTKEEDEILYKNGNGVATIEEIQTLLPHRTEKSIKSRLFNLGLWLGDPNYKAISNTKEYRKNKSIEYRYKTKFGILLDEDELMHTYSPIQWWKWLYYGTPNGAKISSLPQEIYNNEENLHQIIRYVFDNVLNYKTRSDFCKTSFSLLKKYKIGFKHHIKNVTLCDLINKLYPNLNLKYFEMLNVPLGYWDKIENCDDYMRHFVENEIKPSQLLDIKMELPKYFIYRNVRESGYGILAYCITEKKHYHNFYEWLRKLYPEWELNISDFNSHVACDGTVLLSKEEMILYEFIKNKLNISIKYITLKNSKYKFRNGSHKYIPDFVIENQDKPVIIEYFGLFRKKYGNSEILKVYYYKTIEKIKYYNSLDDYEFIPIFPSDIIKKEKLRVKITNKLNKCLKGGETFGESEE